MRVRWATPARLDLCRHIRFIAIDSPTAARLVAERVREAAAHLATHPLLGRPGHVVDTRELVVPGTPFTLAYRVTGEGTIVEIVGVVHQAREWPESFE